MALIAGIRFRHIPAKRFILSKQTQKIKCRTLKVQSIDIKFNEIEPKFVTLIYKTRIYLLAFFYVM